MVTEKMTREKYGPIAVSRTVPSYHGVTLQKLIDKPRYTEASVLCKVLGSLRTIFMELV
jgi:hypothetical protein